MADVTDEEPMPSEVGYGRFRMPDASNAPDLSGLPLGVPVRLSGGEAERRGLVHVRPAPGPYTFWACYPPDRARIMAKARAIAAAGIDLFDPIDQGDPVPLNFNSRPNRPNRAERRAASRARR